MGDEECPFCGNHPYEWVDIGVGSQPVAVTCCSAGHGLLAEGVPRLQEAAVLLRSENEMSVEKGREIVRKYELGM